MTLEAFIFFMAGAIGEILLLWSGGRRGGSRLVGHLTVIPVPIERLAALGLIGVALLLTHLARWLGAAEIQVSLDDGWVGMIFVLLGLFLLGAGVIADGLLPRVDERAVLTVQILIAILTLTADRLPAWPVLLALAGLPLMGSLALVFWREAIPAVLQALVYFGYLLALLALTFQTSDLSYFNAPDLSSLQALAFGGLFIFLLLHALFAVRFFLIVSSLILPRNRPLVGAIMPRLFSNEQVPLLRFGLFTVVLAGVVILNVRYEWIEPAVLVSLAVMISAQVMGLAGEGKRRGG